MKWLLSKKNIISSLIYVAGIVLLSTAAYIGFMLLPSAIEYSIPQDAEEKAAGLSVYEQETEKIYKYEKLSDICEKGPFTIESRGNEIFVFEHGKCLYRVKAKLFEFPDKDKQTISCGITAIDYPELCEIVSYLES